MVLEIHINKHPVNRGESLSTRFTSHSLQDTRQSILQTIPVFPPALGSNCASAGTILELAGICAEQPAKSISKGRNGVTAMAASYLTSTNPRCGDPVSFTSPYFDNMVQVNSSTLYFHVFFLISALGLQLFPLIDSDLFQNIKVILNSGFVSHLTTEKYTLISGYIQNQTLFFFFI